jgi:hypothetical protein
VVVTVDLRTAAVLLLTAAVLGSGEEQEGRVRAGK